MRILTLSNFYPPHHVSGYAMLCADVMHGLRERGHDVVVLTSTHGCEGESADDSIHRILALESRLDYYRPLEGILYPLARHRNLRHLRRLFAEVRPDLVFVWGMWNLSKSLAEEAEHLAGPRVVYYLANPWPIEANQHQAYWALRTRRPQLDWVKKVARLVARLWLHAEWREPQLQFAHAPCCSGALRDQLIRAGVILQDSPTIYEGVDIDSLVQHGAARPLPVKGGVLSLVYVGLLVPHKGVHTAIEALSRLPADTLQRVRLTILGSGHPAYEDTLRRQVASANLSGHVTFAAPIPRTELPGFLSRHHVLLLPSVWEEPLALIMQEGLASGLVVVGSTTGGTSEIIRDGQNGLLFPAEDAGRLAVHIERLAGDPTLWQTLAHKGQESAKRLFDLRRMVGDLEGYLDNVRATSHAV